MLISDNFINEYYFMKNMWTTSISANNHDSFINILANKYELSFFGYPLNIQTIDDELYVTFYGWINDTKQKSEKIFEEMKKNESVLHVEHYENSFILCMKQPADAVYLYSANIIYLRPIHVKQDFTQTYVLASWNREDLNKILQLRIPGIKFNLHFIKEKPIENIGLFAPTRLTVKQQDAFLLAQQEGYYEFPKRGSHLSELAKLSNISLATYQAHLRKAERKILSTYVELE